MQRNPAQSPDTSPLATHHSPTPHRSLFTIHHLTIVTIALAGVLTAACATTPRPALSAAVADRPVMLAVVTWNLHAGRANLAQFVDDLTGGRVTGEPVRRYVLLLQENIAGSRFDAVALARRRQLWSHFAPVRESGRGTSGNAILTTEAPLAVRTIELPRERRVRKATIATIALNDRPFFIVNTHLENRISWLKGGLFSEGARARQAEALLRALPAGPGVAGGDFNTWLGEDEPAMRALLARFTDTPPGLSEPTFRDRLAIDHLFFDLPRGWEAVRRVVREKYGSDHHPVIGLVVPAGAMS